MNRRTLEALRALAERPGTPAEGEVAREKLKRYEARRMGGTQAEDAFLAFLRNHATEAFIDAMRAAHAETDRARRQYEIFVAELGNSMNAKSSKGST